MSYWAENLDVISQQPTVDKVEANTPTIYVEAQD